MIEYLYRYENWFPTYFSERDACFPFMASKIRRRNARLPVSGCRKPRSNVKIRRAARPCAETHRGGRIASTATNHRYGQYHRPAATDSTSCSSDGLRVIIASCAGHLPATHNFAFADKRHARTKRIISRIYK